MTPLDYLRLWFVGLDSDLQYEVAFTLILALEDGFRGRRFQSERDFVRAFEAWLADERSTLGTHLRQAFAELTAGFPGLLR